MRVRPYHGAVPENACFFGCLGFKIPASLMSSTRPSEPCAEPLGARARAALRGAGLALVSGFVAAGSLALVGCSDDETFTPDACPPLHEYDIRELYAEENRNDPDIARRRAGIEKELEAAAEKGCVTKPTYTPPLKD